MRHVTMVSKFPWISTNYVRKKKTKKLTRMNFLCIALRDKTIAHTFLPSLDSANGRLCQEKFLRSRIFATMVTWRHTSPLYSDLAKLFNWRIHRMTNCANSLRAGSPVRIREKFWRRSSHTLMAKPSQPVIFFFPQSSQMIKSKIRQLKRKETKKGKSHSDVESLNNSAAPSPMGVVSPPDHSAETKDDGVTADVNQEGQVPPEGKKKRKMTKKKENGKVEGEKVSFRYLFYYLYLKSMFLPKIIYN